MQGREGQQTQRGDGQQEEPAVAVPAEASPGSPAHEPATTTAADGVEAEDAWRQGIHLASGSAEDADGSGQARSGYWDDEDDPERPDET
ncbi:hypothetical protein WDZ17_04495 [Pseudokineococcus basanitobsidens]|uniref:DUF5709 domain-containing protein n=1 Tax=Pseudokineococcus basanitobsidens TaxID=1926649 RepID=A0ABU8RHR0_9ACTN